MDQRRRIFGSGLAFLIVIGLLFGVLLLVPAMAQPATQDDGPAPDAGQLAAGDISAQVLVSSTTGYAIDDGGPGFTATLSPDGWLAAPVGYGGDCLYTDVTAGSAGDYAQWRPDLAAGTYEVLVYFVADSNRRNDVRYTIVHSGGTSTSGYINQNNPVALGVWRSLGTYTFAGGTSGYVRLYDSKEVWGIGQFIIADAVVFAPVQVWVDDDYTPVSSGGHVWGVDAFAAIQAGVDAVAPGGTVYVRSGTYYQTTPITLTKAMTLTGDSAATTVISTTVTDVAIAMLASDVHISKLTLESPGVDYGIANNDPGVGWTLHLSGGSIKNVVIRGFRYGIRLRNCAAEIANNTIYQNSRIGIWSQDYPNTGGPTTISGNILYGNGSGATNEDIRVQDSYTGTLVSGNTITGELGAGEAGIKVLDQAWGVSLVNNAVLSCTQGISIVQESNLTAQKIDLKGNTVTNGTVGVRIQRIAGTFAGRHIVIGGSTADANSIYGNAELELQLIGYSADISATHNYWGKCLLREIEDEIRHDYDAGALGLVTYEPALCVPYTITIDVSPTTLPADGTSTAMVTAVVRDVAGNYANPGTLIGIYTNLGSVPYAYEEEDGSGVTLTGPGWGLGLDGHASGGQYAGTANVGDTATWTFNGPAVSLIYLKAPGGGSAEVRVDGTLIKTLNMMTSVPGIIEWLVEDVIVNNASAGSHTIEVKYIGGGTIWVDAFRSGGAVVSQGRVSTTLTASNTPGMASVSAVVYDGRIVRSDTPIPFTYPWLTAATNVQMLAADVAITKLAAPASINRGQEVTYTIAYSNVGPETATGTLVTDTLPADFVYVRSSSVPSLGAPASAPGNEWVWNVGTLPSGGSGTITLVARPDPALLWSLPVLRTNWVQILSKTGDPALGNNAAFADVNIIVPTALAITASPPVIRVSNGTIVTTLRITVTDSLANLVDGVPIALSTTAGTFPASGAATLNVTTTNGVATASLASSTTVTTATVTASVIPAGVPNGSVDVFFAPGLPFAVTSVVVPTMIEVCGAEAVVTATVRDQFGNLVADGTNVTFNVVQGPRGDMFPRLTTTVGGIAVSTVRTKSYLFGERFLDVYILASREAQEAGGYQRVDLKEGPPAGITMKATPSMLQVNGKEATVEALVLDCGGNKVVNGTLVTFTANGLGTITPTVAATVNGYAYSVFKSFCQTGTGVVTATSGAAVSALNIPIEPGPADHIFVDITPDTISNCGGRATVEATVYDVCNNLVKDGTLVLFAPQYGYVSVTPVLAVTRNGKVTATAIADRNKMLATWPLAQEQIDVTSGSAVPGFDNLTITPGAAAKVDMSVDPAAIPINGDVNGYDIIVSAMVKDCSNTPVVDGTAVDLRTSLGLFRESGSRNLLRNTVNGLVTATLTSQSIAGSVVLTGTAGSAVGSVAARFLPGEPWMLEVDAIPETIFANGRSTTLIAARVKDEYDNPVLDGITVTLVADYGFFSDTGTGLVTRTTDTQGYVFATLVSDTVPRTVLVRAIAYNDRQGYTYVFFIEGDYKYLYMPNIRKFSP